MKNWKTTFFNIQHIPQIITINALKKIIIFLSKITFKKISSLKIN